MARVDFYLLRQTGAESRYAFACRLAEKAYRLENSVQIHTATEQDANRIDDLLWTFRDGSFVPHDSSRDNEASRPAPVRISCGDDVVEPRDLLINLCDEIPPFAEAFPRVAELAVQRGVGFDLALEF